jgi:hypothetical protein
LLLWAHLRGHKWRNRYLRIPQGSVIFTLRIQLFPVTVNFCHIVAGNAAHACSEQKPGKYSEKWRRLVSEK